MDRIAEQFDGFKRPGFFSRIDAKHILELHIGLDEKGRKAIELRASFTPVKVTGTSAIDVNQYRKDEYNTIRFSLKRMFVVHGIHRRRLSKYRKRQSRNT